MKNEQNIFIYLSISVTAEDTLCLSVGLFEGTALIPILLEFWFWNLQFQGVCVCGKLSKSLLSLNFQFSIELHAELFCSQLSAFSAPCICYHCAVHGKRLISLSYDSRHSFVCASLSPIIGSDKFKACLEERGSEMVSALEIALPEMHFPMLENQLLTQFKFGFGVNSKMGCLGF